MPKSKKTSKRRFTAGAAPLINTLAAKAAARVTEELESLPLAERTYGINGALGSVMLKELPPFRPTRRIAEAYLRACLTQTTSAQAKKVADAALRAHEKPGAYNHETWVEGISLARKAYLEAMRTA